jgi:DNA-directed RNA polymerase subunit beta'
MIQHKIIENIQKVYLSQGVGIADVHFEVIVRRMTAWGKIRQAGDSGLFRHEIMPLHRIEKVNAGTEGNKAIYEPVIVGISAASLNAESFLSAASFQETSRVLTRDALEGKTDFLRGVKERVILGDLIPAGTGFTEHVTYIAIPDSAYIPTPRLEPIMLYYKLAPMTYWQNAYKVFSNKRWALQKK